MKILLLGSSGMLGRDCKELWDSEYEVIAPDRKELDIISWDVVIENLHKIRPDIIINCVGFTDVDACEEDDFKVRKVYVEGPRNLAQGSARYNCRLIHISSDYVFNGQKGVPQPYFEDDPVDPISAYARSKMESEVAVRENAPNYIIIRSAWLYGLYGDNFINKIIRKAVQKNKTAIQVVADQFGSPTWTFRLACQIQEFIKTDARGTFHATSEGYCSRLECAQYVLKKLKLKATIEPCRMKDYVQKAKRPVNCILENRLIKKLGLNVMHEWKEDIDLYLDKYGDELIKKAKS